MKDITVGVSVIIPAYNAAAYLGEALASLAGQDHPTLEILVVDDGSQEDLEPFVRGSPRPARFIRQANKGPAAARNLGLKATSHPYVAFLDADDLWLPGGLDRMVAAASVDANRQIIHGRARRFHVIVDEEGRGVSRRSAEARHELALGSMLLRRGDIERIGGFREDFGYGEDADLLSRLEQAGVTRHLMEDEVLLWRRGHAGLTLRFGRAAQERAWFRIARDRVKGRRKQG
jgi:glycosyltransferase involved in cell wall biosynthesis